MSTQKSQTIGEFIMSIFICFMVIGVILGVSYNTEQKTSFNPLPYALGNVYDADVFQSQNTRHASVDVTVDANRG